MKEVKTLKEFGKQIKLEKESLIKFKLDVTLNRVGDLVTVLSFCPPDYTVDLFDIEGVFLVYDKDKFDYFNAVHYETRKNIDKVNRGPMGRIYEPDTYRVKDFVATLKKCNPTSTFDLLIDGRPYSLCNVAFLLNRKNECVTLDHTHIIGDLAARLDEPRSDSDEMIVRALFRITPEQWEKIREIAEPELFHEIKADNGVRRKCEECDHYYPCGKYDGYCGYLEGIVDFNETCHKWE